MYGNPVLVPEVYDLIKERRKEMVAYHKQTMELLNELEINAMYTGSVTIDDVPTHPDAPVITLEPVGATITEGDNYTLSANAHVYESVQWFKDGAELVGANTPDYAMAPSVVGDTGVYHAVFTNKGVSTATAIANMVVDAVPEPPTV